MQAGQLDRRLKVYQPYSIPDSFGEVTTNWQLAFTVWAKRTDLLTVKSSERVMNNVQKVGFGITQFKIRYRVDILPTTRLECDGVAFDVVAMPVHDGRRQWTLINAEQRDNNYLQDIRN